MDADTSLGLHGLRVLGYNLSLRGNGEGITVQCIGGRLLIKRVRPSGSGKITASEWAATVSLSVGDLLGSENNTNL